MPRKSKSKSKSSTKAAPSTPLRQRLAAVGRSKAARVLLIVLLAGSFAGGGLCGLASLEDHIHTRRASQNDIRFTVRLENIPAWVPPTLARLVTRELIPPRGMDFEDPALCRRIYDQAHRAAWLVDVASVRRVRTGPDTGRVDVTATFRRPVARVRYQQQSWFVDTRGVILPPREVPRWAARTHPGGPIRYYISDDAAAPRSRVVPIHYILIDGVRTPPPSVGQPWDAPDLQAGIRLVNLVNQKDWANQITVVDVRNFDRRVTASEPELRMYAQTGQGHATDIRFGRFPHPGGGDWVISPARKLEYLDQYASDHGGRLAGINSYIDVRYDELRVSIHTYEN